MYHSHRDTTSGISACQETSQSQWCHTRRAEWDHKQTTRARDSPASLWINTFPVWWLQQQNKDFTKLPLPGLKMLKQSHGDWQLLIYTYYNGSCINDLVQRCFLVLIYQVSTALWFMQAAETPQQSLITHCGCCHFEHAEYTVFSNSSIFQNLPKVHLHRNDATESGKMTNTWKAYSTSTQRGQTSLQTARSVIHKGHGFSSGLTPKADHVLMVTITPPLKNLLALWPAPNFASGEEQCSIVCLPWRRQDS